MALEATQIEQLKEEHGVIFKLDIPMSDETETTLIVKEVGRKDFKIGSAIIEKDSLKGMEYFLRTLTVFGDPEAVINDFNAFRTAVELMAEIIAPKEGKIAKL